MLTTSAKVAVSTAEPSFSNTTTDLMPLLIPLGLPDANARVSVELPVTGPLPGRNLSNILKYNPNPTHTLPCTQQLAPSGLSAILSLPTPEYKEFMASPLCSALMREINDTAVPRTTSPSPIRINTPEHQASQPTAGVLDQTCALQLLAEEAVKKPSADDMFTPDLHTSSSFERSLLSQSLELRLPLSPRTRSGQAMGVFVQRAEEPRCADVTQYRPEVLLEKLRKKPSPGM